MNGPGRLRLDGDGRVAGLDVARGLAVLGMLAAHLLVIETFEASDPSTWVDVVNGRSSILFAVAAGVSLALVSGGRRPVGGERLRVVRLRIAVRAALLWILGILLILTGVPVFVILPAYAILFLLALPLLASSARALWLIAAVGAVLLPFLQPFIDEVVSGVGPDIELMLGWHYPFTLWIVFVAAGLAVGRSDLRTPAVPSALLFGGAATAVIAYTAAAAIERWIPDAANVLTADAHSGGLFEVVGSGGFALAVLGGAVLACRVAPVRWLLLPVRAVGSMPLTAYAGQILGWAVAAQLLLGDTRDLSGFRALDPLPTFLIVTVSFCTAWAILVGRGPLESLLSWAVRVLGPRQERPAVIRVDE